MDDKRLTEREHVKTSYIKEVRRAERIARYDDIEAVQLDRVRQSARRYAKAHRTGFEA